MAKKRETAKKKEKIVSIKMDQSDNVEKILVENFVSLQKVMTTLAVKFDNLSGQISKLLELFEISAKTLAEKGYSTEGKTDPKIAEKLNNLLDQNKIIAKGVAMLYEKNMPEEQEEEYAPAPQQPIQKSFPPQQYAQQQRPVNPGLQRTSPVDFSKTQKFGNLEA